MSAPTALVFRAQGEAKVATKAATEDIKRFAQE
jgi:hypothetical protein